MKHTLVRRVVLRALVVVAAMLLPAAAKAQEPVTISGRVTNEAGEPLRVANVAIGALNIVVYANADGNYRLVVPAGRAASQNVTVTARQIGFRAASATVQLVPGTTLTQNFRLVADPLKLDEVVVTGAGTEALAERIGTARASLSAQEVMKANEPNILQAMAGKVPGIVTHQMSGDPTASTAMQIRGAKTFGAAASQPTIIVDGVPINNTTRPGQNAGVLSGAPMTNRASDINPEDIESIEILKGAAATSIYGAAAGSAGAILITTKRGKAGQVQYSLRSTYQQDKPLTNLPYQTKYGVGTGGVSTQCTTVNCTIGSGFFSWGPELPAGTQTYDHGAEVFETGRMLDNTLSMSGGTDRTTFFLSAGALDHDGFVVQDNDFLKRYSFRVNASHSLLDNLTVGASASYVQTKSGGIDRGNAINGIGLAALRQPPNFNARQYLDTLSGLHRSWRFPNPGPTAFTTNRGFDNPFYAINENELTAETGRYFGNINANWRALPWLQVNYTLGGDYASDDRTNAFGRSASGLPGGQIERWQFYDRIIDHNLNATATKDFSQNFKTSFTVGQNLNETYFRQINVVGQTWIAPRPYRLANTVSRTIPNDAETRRRVEGYFGQATADLWDQLFLQARIRNDGNSAFGIGNQRAWYPGGQVAWSFTKAVSLPESFITFGKLRAAYGESGQQPPLYATQDIYTTALFADFNPASIQAPTLNGIGGIYAGAVQGNPNISPERVKEFEAGADFNLFKGFTDLSFTYYTSKSEDVVFGVSLPPSTGYTAVNLNAGALENKGWEATMNFRPIQRSDFAVEIGANWGRNRNKVTSLGVIDAQLAGTVALPTAENCGPEAKVPRCETGVGNSFSGQTTHVQVGYPLGTWRANDFARCGISTGTISFQGTSHNVGAACEGQPHGALYIAANGFPITDPTVRAQGNPWPDWTAGLSANVRIKGVELSAFLDHRQGGNVLNMTRASMYQYGTHGDTEIRGQTRTFGKDMLCHNITCDVLNGPVVGPGAGTAVVIGEGWFSAGALGNGQGATGGPISQRLEDGTNTRLREVSIGYNFRGGFIENIAGLRQVDVKFSGRNIKLWTDYSGYDPETNLGGAANANRGIDFFNAPMARAWVMSVTLHR
jgi:TonB-linked SusC/RagA family outer membrane protein